MSKRTKCQTCKLDFGTKVMPSDFCFVKELVDADVAQLCTKCAREIPARIRIDLMKRPKFFADNAIKKRRYQYKKYSLGKVNFDDHRLIINTNRPEVVGTV